MTDIKIICDQCKQSVSPSQKQKKLRKGFFEILLVCPFCHFGVHSYYSNNELQRAQQVLENFKKNSTRSPLHRQRYEKKLVEFMAQHKKVQERFASGTA